MAFDRCPECGYEEMPLISEAERARIDKAWEVFRAVKNAKRAGMDCDTAWPKITGQPVDNEVRKLWTELIRCLPR